MHLNWWPCPPTDKKRHPVHGEIQAKVWYLPEYLHDEPLRVAKAFLGLSEKARPFIGTRSLLERSEAGFSSKPVSASGQAAVLVAEWPQDANWLHVHFIHTPASVARYASMISAYRGAFPPTRKIYGHPKLGSWREAPGMPNGR